MNEAEARVWNATLYLRLSREDEDKEESNSISGQRELLRDYLSRHPDLREYAIRIDDGFSGTTFDRPAFREMMEDIRAGKTDCVIVKDLSRFGRNYLDTGEYIETIFPFLGVRFIAVNDGYDSQRERTASDYLMLPFKNLINEAYCRDISIKIRSQLAVKRKRGDYLGSFAVYGYLKSETDKNQLVVDEYAADVVRDIFRWKLEGASPGRIADRLNSAGILSPAEYKRSMGMKYTTPFQTKPKALWSASGIISLLKNKVYIGVLTQGIMTTPSYKVQKRIRKAEQDWIVIGAFNSSSSLDIDTYGYEPGDKRFLAQDAVLKNTNLKDLIATWYPAPQFVQSTYGKDRRDYVYVSPSLLQTVVRASCFTDSFTPGTRTGISNFSIPSDHRPFIVDFNL